MQLMGEGVDLLIYGMGVVFFFLGVLVVATNAMSRLVNRFFPEPAPVPGRKRGGDMDVDELTRKVIQAAVDKHRGRRK